MDGKDFKLIFTAGSIFRDELAADCLRQRDDMREIDERFTEAVRLLTDRGVAEKTARRLLFGVPDKCGCGRAD